jgi:(E)-4-hydroxy-3-methylbut-2-enyl-diphosphate synthase
MIKRRKTKSVQIGTVQLGTKSPIAVQSMCKVPTTDLSRCARQIRELARAGCALVRVAVPRRADTQALAQLIERADVPLVADIHFSAERAIEAIEAGAAKIRLNPGNIKNPKDIARIIDCAKLHSAGMRIGINEASIRDLKGEPVPFTQRISLMMRKMKRYVRLFEKRNFDQLVLSAKSSDTLRTIEINRAIADHFDYPIHLGLTHAGLPEDAQIPSAVALGTLLAEGIGDTIRVSAAGNPVVETGMAYRILESLGLAQASTPELIVCPTCGRTEIDVIKLARRVKRNLKGIKKSARVAVMGCFVNGPGEAEDADLAICAGKGKAFLYKHGKKIAVVSEDNLITRLLQELDKL